MATTTYNLAPNPVWQFTDFAALYLSNGKMYTWEDLERTVPKPVYKDPEGMTPWPNPLIFGDPTGSAYPIYWASDSNYYVEIYDQFGNLQYVFSQFNAPGFVTPEFPTPPINKNYIIDGQFRFPNAQNFLPLANNTSTWISPKCYFTKSASLTSVDNATFIPMAPGQTNVPWTPYNYLNLKSYLIGGDTLRSLNWLLGDYNQFEGQTICFSFYASSPVATAVSIYLNQQFGTGGTPSPTVTTPVFSATLTSNFVLYSGSIVVPSTSGATLGTNDNASLVLTMTLPANTIYEINITNCYFQYGAGPSQYDFNGYNLGREQVYGQKLPVPAYGNPSPDIGKFLTIGTEISSQLAVPEPAYVLSSGPYSTGDVKISSLQPSQGPWPGWIIANGTPVGAYQNSMSAYALFFAEYVSFGGFSAGIFFPSGDGFSTAIVSSVNVVSTNITTGVSPAAVDVNTGMTITVTVPGAIGVAQVINILALPQSSLTAGNYFKISGTTNNFACYITINGVGNNPNIVGYTGIPIPLTTGMTANQVASVISLQLSAAFFSLDFTGFFPRFGPTNPTNVRDPDYSSRNGGNAIGSSQSSAIQTHTHTYSKSISTLQASGSPTGFLNDFHNNETGAPNGATVSSGETRSINMYFLPLVKL